MMSINCALGKSLLPIDTIWFSFYDQTHVACRSEFAVWCSVLLDKGSTPSHDLLKKKLALYYVHVISVFVSCK